MNIVKYPHPSLRHPAVPLKAINQRIQDYVRAMLDLMYEGKGLGLAGPQVALPYQIFVMNLVPEERELPRGERINERVYINPVIGERKGSVEGEEGCLSFPGLYQKVRRAKTITFQAYNEKGEVLQGAAADLEARVWQHEVDHLHGKLFIDMMGALGKLSSRSDLKQFERDYRKSQEHGDIPAEDEIQKQLLELEALA
jgi:peptide deformylase